MMPYEQEAIELLIKTEKIYNGTNRVEMKRQFVSYIETWERIALECCPFYIGLVIISGLRMLDECPDYN